MKPYVDIVNVSLHGATEKTNDAIMMVPGAAKKIKNNILKLVDSGYDVHVTCVAIKDNQAEFYDLANWCCGAGVKTFCLNLLFGRGRGGQHLLSWQPRGDDLQRVTDEMRKIFFPRLNIYTNFSHIGQCILVRPGGDLTGAPQNPESDKDGLIPIGNVQDVNIKDKWDKYPYRINHHLYNREKFALYLNR